MKIFISGKITGKKNYKHSFSVAEKVLSTFGHSVMNPAWLVEYEDFTWEDYMSITKAMLQTCEGIYLLPDWQLSKGSLIEYKLALKNGIKIFTDIKKIPVLKGKSLK